MQSPLEMCKALGLNPSAPQRKAFVELAECPRKYNMRWDDDHINSRAAAVFALWRILNNPGSHAVILAPNDRVGSDFMAFLEAVTTTCSTKLAAVTLFPNQGTIQFGTKSNWALHLISKNPLRIRVNAPEALVSIILQASHRDADFEKACALLEEHSTRPDNTLLRIW